MSAKAASLLAQTHVPERPAPHSMRERGRQDPRFRDGVPGQPLSDVIRTFFNHEPVLGADRPFTAFGLLVLVERARNPPECLLYREVFVTKAGMWAAFAVLLAMSLMILGQWPLVCAVAVLGAAGYVFARSIEEALERQDEDRIPS